MFYIESFSSYFTMINGSESLGEIKSRDEALHVTMSSGGRQMQIQNNQVGVF